METDIDKIKTALENSNLIKTYKDLYWKLWTVITEYEKNEEVILVYVNNRCLYDNKMFNMEAVKDE